MVGFAGNLREFPLPILCGDVAGGSICNLVPLCALIALKEGLRFWPGAGGTICKLVPLCALIALTEGLRFWPLHSLSFLLMCSLH